MKNKKILVITLLASTLGLASCGGPSYDIGPKEHEHFLSVIEEKEPTFFEDGNIEYFYCKSCEKCFSDYEAQNEISVESTILPKEKLSEYTSDISSTGHKVLDNASVKNAKKQNIETFDKYVVPDTGILISGDNSQDYSEIQFDFNEISKPVSIIFDYRYVDMNNDKEYANVGHTFLKRNVQSSFEFLLGTSNALINDGEWHTYTYKNEDKIIDLKSIVLSIYHFSGELIISNFSILYAVGKSSSTPSTHGLIEHFEDLENNCYLYSEEDGEYVQLPSELIVDSHPLEEIPSTSTCTEAGYAKHYKCPLCEKLFYDVDGKKELDIDGNGEYIIPKGKPLGHSTVLCSGKSPTHTQDGWKDYYRCENCSCLFEDSSADILISNLESWKGGRGKLNKDVNAHTYDGGRIISDPTCTAPGRIVYTCTGCLQEKFEDIPAIGHEFLETGKCSHCNKSLKDEYDLEEGSVHQNIVTLSDIGMTSPFTMSTLGGGHLFLDYNFMSNKGIDLRFNFTHSYDADNLDPYMYFYLGNQRDESGLILRIKTVKYSDSNLGYHYGYLGAYSPITFDNAHGSAALENNFVIYPVDTDSPNATYSFRVLMDLIDESTCKFKVNVYMSADGGATWTSPVRFSDHSQQYFPLEVTFGNNYFNGKHNIIRFSNHSSSMVVSDFKQTSKTTVGYYSESGVCFGTKTYNVGEKISLPKFTKPGYKFIGWFDRFGNEYNEGSLALNIDTRLTSRFILDTSSESNVFFTPSTEGIWQEYEGFTTDKRPIWPIPVVEGQTKSIDLYVMYRYKEGAPGVDAYNIMSFPFDQTTYLNRVLYRLAARNTARYYRGFLYGMGNTSIPTAGGTGTEFSETSFILNEQFTYMIHMVLSETENDFEYNIKVELINLGNFAATTTISKTYTCSDKSFSISNPDCMYFGIADIINGCKMSLKQAW